MVVDVKRLLMVLTQKADEKALATDLMGIEGIALAT